jgi:AmmeMemoRadiSam system protein B
MDKPKLRNLHAVQTELSGRKVLVFQDPERISPDAVAVPIELAPIIQYFDGTHSIRDIQADLMRRTGQLIDSEQISKVVDDLDQHLLLESQRFFAHLDKINKAWDQADVRPPSLAGTAYPESGEELRSMLAGFYNPPQGPGNPGDAIADDLKGILAPHIELRGNGPCYAHAYKALAERTRADTFFIIGTAHFEPYQTFIFCEKDFATPLGIVETDREFIQGVKGSLRDQSKRTDMTHRLEHSIELQVIFIQHLLEGKKKFKIIPLLVGSFQNAMQGGGEPEQDPLVKDFIEVVKEGLSEREGRVCFICSGDLAHLGPRYGQQENFDPIREQEIQEDDEDMLKPLIQADAKGFFKAVADIQDRRNVCGLSPLYTMLQIIEPERGELLKWSCWFDRTTRSAVSFASMAFY